MAYGRKWKPSKKAIREWVEKKEALESDDTINTSASSAYFEVRGVKYRVSGHSPEAAANHIAKRVSEGISFDGDIEQIQATRENAKQRGAGEVQIWAAQTKAREIKSEIENRTFGFQSARYFNRKEAMQILKENGEIK